MVLLTKRFNKIFRFSLVAALCCLIFVLSTRYIDQDLSSLEYVRYLQNYHETYSGNGNKVEPEVETPPAPAANDKIKSPSGGPVLSAQDQKRRQALQEFYKQVFKNLRQHSPTGSSSRQYDEKCQLNGDIGARANDYNSWSKLTSKNLGNCLKLSNKEKTMLKETHYDFVESLKSLVLPKGTYKGDGIVTVGGGKFSMLSFLIIKTLRNLGTHLPVEVFIPPNDEGEEEFCNTLLPKYNAKCIYISDVLPEDIIENFDFKGYQFKSISIIASSFENLLLLDADNFPIKALDNIFEEEPYKSTGMVLWPDFWRRTTNPAYYEIADIAVNYKKRVRNCMDDITPPQAYTKDMKNLENVPLHDLEGTIPDVSTESGQLMIRKSRHLPTILLSLYYNVNGPTWYYPIFSQKASGEGDKETFIAAANFYGLPFYQVKSVTAVDGYHQPDNKGFRGVAMLQHDFVQDYSRYKWAKSDIENKYAGKVPQFIKQDTSYSPDAMYKTYFEPEDLKEVDIMFVHSNLPKFDPYTLWNDKDLIVDGKHIRSYTNLRRLNNYDLELENFKVFKEYLCVSRTKFKYLDDSLQGDERQWKSMCGYIKERLNFLDQTHSDAINAS
ncbi:alpha-1,2-mannosyltransferase MNN2 [Lachancea thermotolerans CBS 6340]|uniref:KLTH0G16038p n=1 Tax=Lachancea thermotolerans (strain ATCC 56472 / CBS 6340 / NRRL Y-8284) TaxID=559295 RepID=C5DND3_LACTC|nr:KLTH0G16038p [Lachancea thermotolerans CBS 6340]CAR25294.1 KLTH0G16038p [Lachancea thermotolerans CBS 6340]